MDSPNGAAEPAVVARYRRKGCVVEVLRGDAQRVPATVVVAGRMRRLRAALEQRGAVFAEQQTPGQRVFTAANPTPEWGALVLIDYRPGHDHITRGWLTGMHGEPHGYRLSHTLWHVLAAALEERHARPLILPLAWRNPDMVAVVTVATLWILCTPHRTWTIRLIDQTDPTPFIRYLNNEDDALARFANDVLWFDAGIVRRQPFRPA